MSPWLKASLLRSIPFAIYLVIYGVCCALWFAFHNEIDVGSNGFVTFLLVGGSIGAFIALWRLSMAFVPDARFAEAHTGYIEIPDSFEHRTFGEHLITHSLQLRRIALSYEKQRQNLSRVGITVAIASLAVPVATWSVILLDAFSKTESMPNAWLLVVSSTTTGALGLAISVTLLRHIKNNQKPLAEISQRLLLCIETNIAISSTDGTAEIRNKTFSSALESFVRPPSIASATHQDSSRETESDNKLATTIMAMLKPSTNE